MKTVKYLIASVVFLLSVACSSVSTPSHSTLNHTTKKSEIVGGWAPIFFKDYNQKELDQIIALANNNQLKSITITYPKSQTSLANRIKTQIMVKTKIIPEYYQSDLKDTNTVQYTHDVVVVTIYFVHSSKSVARTTALYGRLSLYL